MSPFDPLPRPPLTAARIRALYERNPTLEAQALPWEIWRLQRLLVALVDGAERAVRHPRRPEVVRGVADALDLLRGEPCVAEATPIEPGAGRNGPRSHQSPR